MSYFHFTHDTVKSFSIGINRFWWVGLIEFFFRVLIGKNSFRLVWLINSFNRPQARLQRLKKHLSDYSEELPRFNRRRLEKCSIEKRRPYQPKPVAVETRVDLNRTRP